MQGKTAGTGADSGTDKTHTCKDVCLAPAPEPAAGGTPNEPIFFFWAQTCRQSATACV